MSERLQPGRGRRPTRVLHFITGFGVGGSERQTVKLVRGLSRAGFEVHLACFRKQGALLREVEEFPCTEFPVQSFRHPRILADQLRFARFVRSHDFDVVHATGLHPNVFAVPAARLAGVPAVLAAIRDLGDPWSPMERRVQRLGCKFAHEVIVNAWAVRDRLAQEGYDGDRITVIHNAVTPAPEPAGCDPLHEEFGVPPEAPVIGVIARLVRVKGIEYFIEAAAHLAPVFPDARFVLVGGPIPGSEIRGGSSYEQELHELVRARGIEDRVIFAGDRNDVPQMLSRFTIAALPSLSEGLPNALLESLAAGVPTIATRVGGSPEIIEDGASGLLVPAGDAGLLAVAIDRLLQSPELAARLAAAGREHVCSHFTDSALIERTSARYLSLLPGSGRSPATEDPTPRAPGTDNRRADPGRHGVTGPFSGSPAYRRQP